MKQNFNSHAHVERDITQVQISQLNKHFNSHAHVERDVLLIWMTKEDRHFNSHAHVERDPYSISEEGLQEISTHTLTWSVTGFIPLTQQKLNISTHTLTWSVTLAFRLLSFCLEHFNSHAHVERDLIGWIYCHIKTISTHTLTWSVTLDVVYIWCLLNVMRTYFFI